MNTQPRPNFLQRAARALYRVRRRMATTLAIVLALAFGYHAIFGHNGITAYAQKRSEDRVLSAQIQKLATENARLKQHVDNLQNDPDAIEREAASSSITPAPARSSTLLTTALSPTSPGKKAPTAGSPCQPSSSNSLVPRVRPPGNGLILFHPPPHDGSLDRRRGVRTFCCYKHLQ